MNKQRRTISFLTPAEIRKIIDTCEDDSRGRRDRAIMEVLFSTGLRISEALRLNRERFLIASTHDKSEKATYEETIIGKGGWQRTVYVSPEALKAVKDYLLKNVYTIKEGENWKSSSDNPLLFTITDRAINKILKKRAIRAGIEKRVSPHVFRHSLATDLLNKGVDIRVVQEFLGHRSITSTQIYTHVASSQLRTIHEKLYK